LRRLDGVADAAVLGLPDQARGDRVAAFLVANCWPIDVSSLPPILQPRELYRLDVLPLTDRGKLDRGRLRALILQPAESQNLR
jgi:long-chain acyl-CoA synthetase